MSLQYFSTEIAPNYDGGLMRSKHIKGGLQIVKTKSQRNSIPYLSRYLDGVESTLCFVENDSQIYKLISNPVGLTTDVNWELVTLNNVSTFKPVGTWDSDNTTPVLDDGMAAGRNGEFYFVVDTPTQQNVTYAGLFLGQTVTVVDGNMIVSVGNQWVVVANSISWDSIAKPQVITDYENGIVQAHTHTTSEITDLATYLVDYLKRSDTADHTVAFNTVPDSAIIELEFLKQWYYTKSEIDAIVDLVDAGTINTFIELIDVPSAYTGHGGKLVKVKIDETGLEFVAGGGGGGHTIYDGVSGTPLTDRANLRFQNGLTASDVNPDTVVKLGGVFTENVDFTGNYSVKFGTTASTGINSFNVYSPDINLLSTDGVDVVAYLQIDNNTIGLAKYNPIDTYGSNLFLYNTYAQFDGNGNTAWGGVRYNIDYSANYTDRTLPDWGNVWRVFGTTTLTGNTTIDPSASNFEFNLGTATNRVGYSTWYLNGGWIDVANSNFGIGLTTDSFDIFTPQTNTGGQIRFQSVNKVEMRTVQTGNNDNRLDITLTGANLSIGATEGSSVQNGLTIWRRANAAPSIGVGVKLRFALGTYSGGDLAVPTSIDYVLTDVTDNAHHSKYIHNVVVAGVSTAIADLDRYGWRYLADYSANYTDRSLIDRGYANATYAPIASTAFWKVTGTSTLTGATTIAQATNDIYFLNGEILFGGTGDTITASTKVDIRGTGTTNAKTLRIANSANTERFYIRDDGYIQHTADVTGTTFTGAWTATGSGQTHISFSPVLTARATASDTLIGTLFTPQIHAAAATQVLVGVKINPNFVENGHSPTKRALEVVGETFSQQYWITTTPDQDNALTHVLVWDNATGKVKKRDSSTLGGAGSYWALTGTSTLLGASTITNNIASGLTFNGAWTATANNQAHINYTGTLSARATNGDALYYQNLTTTLNAGANNQSLILQAFSGTYALGANTGAVVVGWDYNGSITGTALEHLAIRTGATSGSVIIGGSSVGNLTTRVDIRGTGSTTANALRIADSGNTERFTLKDNGNISANAGTSMEFVVNFNTTLSGSTTTWQVSNFNQSTTPFQSLRTITATNSVATAGRFVRETSGSNDAANGIGVSIDLVVENSTSGTGAMILAHELLNATAANMVSRFSIDGYAFSTTVSRFFEVNANSSGVVETKNFGPVKFMNYTTGALPAAANHQYSVAYDTTVGGLVYSNGSAWSAVSSATGAWSLASGGTLTGNNTITGTGFTLKYIWTGLGTTQTNGYGEWFANTTAAANAAQQISPSTVWEGQGWATAGSSQSVKWSVDVLPVQGSINPGSIWRLRSSVNGAAYTLPLQITNDGGFTFVGTDTTGFNINTPFHYFSRYFNQLTDGSDPVSVTNEILKLNRYHSVTSGTANTFSIYSFPSQGSASTALYRSIFSQQHVWKNFSHGTVHNIYLKNDVREQYVSGLTDFIGIGIAIDANTDTASTWTNHYYIRTEASSYVSSTLTNNYMLHNASGNMVGTNKWFLYQLDSAVNSFVMGQTLLAASSGDTITSGAKLDIRGTGTTTNKTLRLSSSANGYDTFNVLDNGNFEFNHNGSWIIYYYAGGGNGPYMQGGTQTINITTGGKGDTVTPFSVTKYDTSTNTAAVLSVFGRETTGGTPAAGIAGYLQINVETDGGGAAALWGHKLLNVTTSTAESSIYFAGHNHASTTTNFFELNSNASSVIEAKLFGPIKLKEYATAGLPAAANHTYALVYDTDTGGVKFSNGSTWSTMGGGSGDMLLGTIQTVTAAKNFNDDTLAIWNPAGTFKYIFSSSALITADKTVTLPLLTASDTFVFEAFAATLTNKTLTSPVINTQITGTVTSANITTTNQLAGQGQTNTYGDFDQSFRDNRLRIYNPADTFRYTIVAAAIAADRTLNLPLLTGTDTIVTEAFAATLTNKTLTSPVINTQITGDVTVATINTTNKIVGLAQANDHTDFDNSFRDNRLRIWNPADTFRYTLVAAAIAADRTLNLPLITATDTLVSEALGQTLTNKTLGTGTIFSVVPTINDGIKFTFNPDATNAGINVGSHAGDPSGVANGDIWYNSTLNRYLVRENGVTRKITTTLTKTVTLNNPGAAENISLFFTDIAVTITSITDAAQGTTPSVTYNIRHATTRNNGTPNDLFGSARVLTSSSGTSTTTFADATIPAGSFVWLITSAVSGTIGDVTITITYTED